MIGISDRFFDEAIGIELDCFKKIAGFFFSQLFLLRLFLASIRLDIPNLSSFFHIHYQT